MPNVIYTATLDFTDNGVFNAGWRIKQGDFGSSSLNITLADNGAIVFDDSIEPEIVFKRADGRSVISTMQSAGENSGYYIYNFVGNELAVPGPCVVDVKIVGSDSRTSTASCRFEVVEDTIGYDETGATTYDNPVASLIEIASTISGESEAYAVGTRKGQPVGPGDPTYENNSKYYYDEIFEILPKVEDDEPYVLRQGLGNKVSFDLEGASVAWNQLVQNGNFASTSNWTVRSSSVTFTASNNIAHISVPNITQLTYNLGISQDVSVISGHKYIINTDYKVTTAGSTTSVDLMLYSQNGALGFVNKIVNTDGNWHNLSTVVASTVTETKQFRLFIGTSSRGTIAIDFKNAQLIDLTQLFGTTIADAIYDMEQATSGSGVAFFRKYFPKIYYAYDSGSIQSVCVSGRKIVGKNLIEVISESQTTGGVTFTVNRDTNGNLINITANGTSTGWINYILNSSIKIIAGTYIFSGSPALGTNAYISIREQDGTELINTNNNEEVTWTLNEDKNLRVQIVLRGSITFNNATFYPMLRLATDTDPTYEPYTETTYPIPTEQLRGLFILKDGKLKADGDILESSGELTRKYKIVHLGSLIWTYVSGNPSYFYANLSDNKVGVTDTYGKILPSNGYEVLQTKGTTEATMSKDKGIALQSGSHLVIVRDSAYSAAAQFTTAMNGVYLVYELAEPTDTSVVSFQMPQKAYADGTEEFIDGLTRDVMVPVGNNSEYFVDDVVDYSTSEQDTGMKWLNGKKIYQKTLDLGSSGISVPANGTAATSESKTGKEQVIWSSAITTDGKTAPYIGGFVGSTYITMENKTGNATTVRYFTFQYTKS